MHNTREGFFTRADFEAVRAQLPLHLRPVMTFGFLTGWRKREILGLRWRDVDLAGGMVRLEADRSKNREARALPFTALPELATLLRSQRDATREVERRTGQIVPWVFHRQGRPILAFDDAWHAACRRAATEQRNGLAAVTRPHLIGRIFHDLRRSA